MSESRVSAKKKISLTAAGIAVAALAGGLVGISASAQADGPTCGLLKANVIGDYDGHLMSSNEVRITNLHLDNDNTYIAGNSTLGAGTWSFADSAIILSNSAGRSVQLVPACAGAKLKPENLIGGDNLETYVFHRQA